MKSNPLTALDYHNQLGLIPSDRVIRRAKTPYYGVIHFGLRTFTNIEGFGSESPDYFDPKDFDAQQICSTCKAAGMQGLIIVCKHHDGFCLWPTETTDYNIRRSPYKKGQGDIVGELVSACCENNLQVGVYISTWDRNNQYYGKPEYPEIYRQQIREICTRYGKIMEFWIDGLPGGPGWYGGAREIRTVSPDYFQWNETLQLIRYLQPDAVICSDFGPDLHWVGNTMGFAAEDFCSQYTPQSTIPDMEALPGNVDDSDAASGHFDGKYFMPFLAPVPLRRSWYYHPQDDGRQRNVATLINIYLNSVGLGGHLALGIAPDTTGKICEEDCRILTEFGTALKEMFRHLTLRSWGRVTRREFHIIKIDRMIFFNLIKIKEDVRLGEMVRAYAIDAMQDGKWVELFRGRSLGFRRIRNIKNGRANQFRIRFLSRNNAKRTPLGLEVRCFIGPRKLLEEATGFTEYLMYGKHEVLTAADITGKVCTWKVPGKQEVGGFSYRANFPADGGSVSKYRLLLQYTPDGEWEAVSEGEFPQIDLNPIPHEVKFPLRRVYAIRLEALETVDPNARKLSFKECRVFYGKEPESVFPIFG